MKTIQQRGLREPGQGAAHPKRSDARSGYRFTEAQFDALVRVLWRELGNDLAVTAAPAQPDEPDEREASGAGVRRRTRRRPSLGRRMAHRVFTGRHA